MRSSGKSPVLTEVRLCLGMSQAEFANCLKVTRGQLSMAELGKRDLPPEIQNQLTKLFNSIHQIANDPGKVLKKKRVKIKSGVIAEAKYRVAHNERKIKKVEKALSKLRTYHKWSTDFLANFDSLREKASEYFHPLFDAQKVKAEDLIEKTGEDAGLNLELRIAAMKGESAFLKKKFKGKI